MLRNTINIPAYPTITGHNRAGRRKFSRLHLSDCDRRCDTGPGVDFYPGAERSLCETVVPYLYRVAEGNFKSARDTQFAIRLRRAVYRRCDVNGTYLMCERFLQNSQ